jgi:DNA polymerase
VPLKYSGAHTHRLSGDWQLNLQNLSNRKNKIIRSAIFAPEGYVILAVDASQIEARLVAWLAQQVDLLQMFRDKIDIYKDFAADIYNVAIELVNALQRFNGKTCILGLGFGMGDARLLYTLTNGAREAGFDVEYVLSDCYNWVNRYRMRFHRIPDLWDRGNNAIFHMAQGYGRSQGWQFGPCVIDQLSIVLPSGLRLWYDNLHKNAEGEYVYRYGRQIKRLYGGKFTENIVQALDRQHVFEAALRIEDRCLAIGIPDGRMIMQEHDANVYCVRKEYAETVKQIALEEMSRTPVWAMPSQDYPIALPLAAEAKMGANYGELE